MRTIAHTHPSSLTSPLSTARHYIACAAMVALLGAMGAVALAHGHKVSERIVQRDQENFSSFRTASSEAGR